MDELELGFVFGRGVCQDRNITRVISHLDEFDNYGSNASSLMMWSRTKNQWHHYNLGWRAIRMGCSQNGMFALGTNSEVLMAGPGGVTDEVVSEKPGGDKATGIRDIALIGDHLYVVGEAGQVFKRVVAGAWADSGAGLPDREGAALNGISGTDDSDIYVVGDGGYICRWNEGKWSRVPCDANVSLHRVRVIDSGLAYATGEQGVLVRIEGDKATVVVNDAEKATLSGVARFNDQVFVATQTQIYRLVKDTLEPVHVVPGPGWTFGDLDAADGVMWSFGKNHLFWTEDGTHFMSGTPKTTHFDPSESGPSPSQTGSACCTGGGHHCA